MFAAWIFLTEKGEQLARLVVVFAPYSDMHASVMLSA